MDHLHVGMDFSAFDSKSRAYEIGGISFGDGWMGQDGGIAPFSTAAKRIFDTGEVMFPQFPQDVCADLGVVVGRGPYTLPTILKALDLLYSDQVGHLLLVGDTKPASAKGAESFAHMLKDPTLPLPKDEESELDYMLRFTRYAGASSDNVSSITRGFDDQFPMILRYRKAESIMVIGYLAVPEMMMLNRFEQEDKRPDGSAPKVLTLAPVMPHEGVTVDEYYMHTQLCAEAFDALSRIDPRNPESLIAKGRAADLHLENAIQRAQTLPRTRKISTPALVATPDAPPAP